MMNNRSLDLSVVKPKKKDFPFTLFVQIELKSYLKENNGKIMIGEKCVTYKELDKHIQRLEKELEDIRKKAKSKFES